MERLDGDPDCPRCGGSGWVRVPDAGAGGASRCSCVKGARVPKLLGAAEIPPKYQGCTLESFEETRSSDPTRSLLRAKTRCRQFLDDYLGETGFRERGLLFIGRPGTGKTHLATAVLAELIRRYGLRGRFVDFTSFIARVQATFDPSSEESKHQVLDPVLNADVLVLDELGAQKPTQFVQDTLYLIINTRYSQRKTTIFTTNFRLSTAPSPVARNGDEQFTRPLPFDLSGDRSERHGLLSERISVALVSRIQEMSESLIVDAEDYRASGRRVATRT